MIITAFFTFSTACSRISSDLLVNIPVVHLTGPDMGILIIIGVMEFSLQLVTYIKSKGLNFYFVSSQPYNKLLSDTHRLRNITLLIAVLITMFGIFMSFMLAGRIYNALSVLISKINSMPAYNRNDVDKELNEFNYLTEAFSSTIEKASSLESQIKTSLPVLKETLLRMLLKGTIDSIPKTADVVNNIDDYLTGPFFCVIVFKIDDFLNFKHIYNSKDQALHLFSICNVAHELLEQSSRNDAIVMEEDEVAVILQLKSVVISEDIVASVVEKVQRYVQDNYSKPDITIDLMADMVQLSSAYLGRLFRSVTGTSFGDYLNAVRMKKARELLSQTDYPASKVSECVGIYNTTYFFTLFKKTCGLTPSQYRTQLAAIRQF